MTPPTADWMDWLARTAPRLACPAPTASARTPAPQIAPIAAWELSVRFLTAALETINVLIKLVPTAAATPIPIAYLERMTRPAGESVKNARTARNRANNAAGELASSSNAARAHVRVVAAMRMARAINMATRVITVGAADMRAMIALVITPPRGLVQATCVSPLACLIAQTNAKEQATAATGRALITPASPLAAAPERIGSMGRRIITAGVARLRAARTAPRIIGASIISAKVAQSPAKLAVARIMRPILHSAFVAR
jgi:hypothetical protein